MSDKSDMYGFIRRYKVVKDINRQNYSFVLPDFRGAALHKIYHLLIVDLPLAEREGFITNLVGPSVFFLSQMS